MKTVERIFSCAKSRKVIQKELAKAIGVTESTLSDWKNGRLKPSIEDISNIAIYLKISADYLLCIIDTLTHDIGTDYTAEEKEIISNYRQMNEQGQIKLVEYSYDLAENGKYKKSNQHGLGDKKEA